MMALMIESTGQTPDDLFGQEHFAHAARAKFGGNAIMANRFADHMLCFPSLSP